MEPTLSKARLIAEALNVSIDFLVHGTEIPETAPKKLPDEAKKLLLLTEDFTAEDFHILLAAAKAIHENKNSVNR